MYSYSFEPIVDDNSKILILGTMPGKKSLEMHEYYAHPRNVFWQIILQLFEFKFTEDYRMKVELLTENNIALWDSLAYCERNGSSDSFIKNEKANDIASLLEVHQRIKTICFNGQAAYRFFTKYHTPENRYKYLILPSTSPANASIRYEDKLEKWSVIKDILKFDNG
jgi:hypoxanthine-DNA glycosylase